MSVILTYSFLLAAVVFGTASNIFAKEAEGFTKLFPSLLSALTIVLCMYCLSQVMKTISAGYTYCYICRLMYYCHNYLRYPKIPPMAKLLCFYRINFYYYWCGYGKSIGKKLNY